MTRVRAVSPGHGRPAFARVDVALKPDVAELPVPQEMPNLVDDRPPLLLSRVVSVHRNARADLVARLAAQGPVSMKLVPFLGDCKHVAFQLSLLAELSGIWLWVKTLMTLT